MEELGEEVPRELERQRPRLFELWGGFLQELHLARFAAQQGPRGEGWDPLSGLTLLLYRFFGIGRTKPGGKVMQESFKKGARGNVYEIGEAGVTYGSDLTTPGGISVVVAFQTTYDFVEDPLSDEAAAVRTFMRRSVGVFAPHPGKDPPGLHHEGRQVVGLSDADDEKLANFMELWVDRVIGEVLERKTA